MKKLLTILVVVFLVACAGTPAHKATQATLTTKANIVAMAQTVDEACSRGMLTQDQCDLAADLYSKVQASYLVSVELLEKAIVAEPGPESDSLWQLYLKSHESLSANLFELSDFLTALGVDMGGNK